MATSSQDLPRDFERNVGSPCIESIIFNAKHEKMDETETSFTWRISAVRERLPVLSTVRVR